MPINVTRWIYLNLLLSMSLIQWLIEYFNPEENFGGWFAAIGGGMIARFFYSGKMSTRTFWLGFLIGVILSCTFSPDVYINGGIWIFKRKESVFALLALMGDLTVQFISWIVRITTKVGDYTLENPGEAFDQVLNRTERVVTVWVKIKTGALDLLDTILKRNQK